MTYEYSPATKIGFGGPRGGTKSHTSDTLMLSRRLTYPGTNGLFIMRVYQDMWDIHLTPMFDAYPELAKHFNKQLMILRLPKGSYIRYLSGENLESFEKRKGRGFADIMVDQSEFFSEDEINFFYTINRSVKPGITPKTLLCFNPGNIGHSYHKRVFHEKRFVNKEKPSEFAFVEAKGWDNAYWSLKEMAELHKMEPKDLTEKDVMNLVKEYHTFDEKKRFNIFIGTDYGRKLDQQKEIKRQQELFGNMDIFEGMFWEEFSRSIHVAKRLKPLKLKNTVGGLDYGNITVLEIVQRAPDGRILVSGECYIGDETNPTSRANEIADYLIENELFSLEIVYDTDMDIQQMSNIGVDRKPIDIFRAVFKERFNTPELKGKEPKMRVVHKKSLDKYMPYRTVVNESVKDYLAVDKITGKSNLLISPDCVKLIDFFESAIHPPKDPTGMDFDRSGIKKDH